MDGRGCLGGEGGGGIGRLYVMFCSDERVGDGELVLVGRLLVWWGSN